jgi:choice-of-anchor B domain-containing protein
MNLTLKRLFAITVILVCVHTIVLAQDSYRMKKIASYNNPNLPKVDGSDIWNDLTGYYDPIKNREYIICGSTDSIYVFDITDAANMKLIVATSGSSYFARNRDYETYKNYVYCVSDQASGLGALQVYDLQYLPDSLHKVYQSNSLGTFTHTIFIDSVSARMYMCSNSKPGGFSAMDIISLQNPEAPSFLAELNVPTKSGGFPLFSLVHEMFARNDTAYVSCGDAGLYIFDLRDLANQRLVGSINSYPDQGYNHSSWLDKTGRYLMFTDENMGLDIKIFDIKSLNNPLFVSQFNSNASATSHNAYWYGDFAYVSAYHDGVRVYNIKDPSNPKQVAWYDTHPVVPEIYGGYKGCWGIYPYLPSKHIIASDLTYGIYVLEIDSSLVGEKENEIIKHDFLVFPNPVHDKFRIKTSGFENGELSIFNTQGKLIVHELLNANSSEIDLSQCAQGIYFIEVNSNQGRITKKILKW